MDYKQLINLNIVNSKSLKDLRYYNYARKHHKEDGYLELPYYGLGERENLDKWKYENFTYKLNYYGFREEKTLQDIDLGIFGCSFTFGQGMPVSRLWHNIIATQKNLKSYNFGLPGGSIQSIMEIFCIATKHVRIKSAIFLLPHLERIQIAKNAKISKELSLLNVVPTVNSKFYQNDFGIDTDEILKYTPIEECIKDAKNIIYLSDKLAQERNINCYITSWGEDTYKMLESMELSNLKILPNWYDTDTLRNEYARDGRHPGPQTHEFFAQNILPHLNLDN